MSVEVTRNIFAIEGAFQGLKDSAYGVALQIGVQAKELSPVDFGQLRNSIMVKSVDKDDLFNDSPSEEKENKKVTTRTTGPDAVVGTNSDHWYPEFGTRYQRAQPFMRPAAEVVIGKDAGAVAKKYGKEAMQKEFLKRKVEKKKIG